MITTQRFAGAVALALTITSVACSKDTSSANIAGPKVATVNASNQTSVVYDQIEFLGNPLVAEVTILKANHDGYNQTQPYNTATYRPETEAFVKSFGRPQELATLLGTVLYPDVLIVDTSKDPATAGWLSWALANGYGGRKLTDDVVDIGLTAIFSTLLNKENAACQPFQLPLCTDNVPANDKAFGATFPYLAAPTL